MPAPPPARSGEVRLPDGATIDVALLHDVASVSNRAHQALGTRLIKVDGGCVVLGIDRPPAHAGVEPSHEWPNGVITALLDHGCAMAALIALDDPARFGGSVGLHVEYLRLTDAKCALHIRAECRHRDDMTARMHAVAFHPEHPEQVLATATATAAVIDR